MKRIAFLVSIILVFSYGVFAQLEDPVKWKNTSEKTEGEIVEITFEANIDMHWHLYSQNFGEGGPVRTTFFFDESDKFEIVGKPIESPEPEEVFDDIFKINVKYHSNKATFVQTIKVLTEEAFVITGSIEYQVCQDDKCVYFNPDFKIKVKGVKIVQESDIEPIVSKIDLVEKEDAETSNENKSLWGFLALSFVLGLAAILTPCVFPMIPMTVSFFMQGQSSKLNSIIKALIFGISIVVLYTSVGLIVSLTSAGADFTTGLSTHWIPNTIFFVLFVAFAASFFGMFEIVLPSGLANKADKQVDKGGFLASFFMAFTLVIVSFSCTGPIVGALLVKAAGGDVLEPLLGMFAFGLAFALPFTLLAIFPRMLKGLPKSGGWMNSIKVVLGFVILAFSLKFVANIDQTYHLNIITRDVFLAIWIVIFILLGIYLLGKLKFSHDSDVPFITVPRLVLAMISFVVALYLLPGMFGADLNAVSALIPPKSAQEFDISKSQVVNVSSTTEEPTSLCESPKYGDILHLSHGLKGYFDYEQGMACAKKLNKPVLLDFKGHACANCKEMENKVWSDPEVLKRLQNDFVIIALYVDDRTKLPENEWVTSAYDGKIKKNIGKVNADFQITKYNINSQPYYVLADTDGENLVEPQGYNLNVDNFINFLDSGVAAFEK
ncbi:MAG: protein-disulfide reductase DsbD family protein [Bacteroidales bacterium]|jgi:thiol:disulfide interchange protein|nr:protein-disulfide reductase DsbD family protein [Bacteroidales bacterium]